MKNTTVGLATTLVVAISNPVHSQVSIMPRELMEFAEQNHCSQISDFFDARPGAVNPPYVYGYTPGHEEGSAVFWCKNPESSEHHFSLMFLFKEGAPEHELAKCPARIEWDNPPRGLSVYRDKRTTLEGFVYLDNPKRKVPKNVRIKHNAIRSYYDGVQELFYCHEGKWLVRQSH